MSQKAGNNGLMYGKFPAVVKSYDAASRECIIQTPVGDEIEAEIEYSIGDNSYNTEIEIHAGDKVWCEFIQGDTRRALITGWRNPKKGNSVGTRHWQHANIELVATASIKLIVGGSLVELTPAAINLIASALNMSGAVGVTGGITSSGDVVAGGISATGHTHTEQGDGNDVSPPK